MSPVWFGWVKSGHVSLFPSCVWFGLDRFNWVCSVLCRSVLVWLSSSLGLVALALLWLGLVASELASFDQASLGSNVSFFGGSSLLWLVRFSLGLLPLSVWLGLVGLCLALLL